MKIDSYASHLTLTLLVLALTAGLLAWQRPYVLTSMLNATAEVGQNDQPAAKPSAEQPAGEAGSQPPADREAANRPQSIGNGYSPESHAGRLNTEQHESDAPKDPVNVGPAPINQAVWIPEPPGAQAINQATDAPSENQRSDSEPSTDATRDRAGRRIDGRKPADSTGTGYQSQVNSTARVATREHMADALELPALKFRADGPQTAALLRSGVAALVAIVTSGNSGTFAAARVRFRGVGDIQPGQALGDHAVVIEPLLGSLEHNDLSSRYFPVSDPQAAGLPVSRIMLAVQNEFLVAQVRVVRFELRLTPAADTQLQKVQLEALAGTDRSNPPEDVDMVVAFDSSSRSFHLVKSR